MKYQRVFIVVVFNLGLLVAFGAVLAGTTRLRHFFSPVVEADKEQEDKDGKRLGYRDRRNRWRNTSKHRAQRAFSRGDFEQSAEAYDEALSWDQTDEDGTMWYRYGYSLYRLGRYDEAIAALHVTDHFPRYVADSKFLQAQIHALNNEEQLAIDRLKEAADAGYFSQISISNEPEFQRLLGRQEFQEQVGRMQSNWDQFTQDLKHNIVAGFVRK